MSLLRLEHVCVDYSRWPRPPTRALNDASLELRRGERLGIVGPSGSGKSSLVRAALGLLREASGHIRWFDRDSRRWTSADWAHLRRRVLWLPQRSEALLHPRMSIQDQLARTAAHHDVSTDRIEHLLAELGIERRAHDLPHRLSGGERRRAALARVLLPSPEVLIADEPTAGLDAERRHEVLSRVLAVPEGGARIVVGHDLPALAAHCDRVVAIVGGRLVADVPCEALRSGTYRPHDPDVAELLDASGYVPRDQ